MLKALMVSDPYEVAAHVQLQKHHDFEQALLCLKQAPGLRRDALYFMVESHTVTKDGNLSWGPRFLPLVSSFAEAMRSSEWNGFKSGYDRGIARALIDHIETMPGTFFFEGRPKEWTDEQWATVQNDEGHFINMIAQKRVFETVADTARRLCALGMTPSHLMLVKSEATREQLWGPVHELLRSSSAGEVATTIATREPKARAPKL